jgi:hypothetical protein
MRLKMVSFDERISELEGKLKAAASDRSLMESLTASTWTIFDILTPLMFTGTSDLRLIAAELYVRRAFHPYQCSGLEVNDSGVRSILWSFQAKDSLAKSFRQVMSCGSQFESQGKAKLFLSDGLDSISCDLHAELSNTSVDWVYLVIHQTQPYTCDDLSQQCMRALRDVSNPHLKLVTFILVGAEHDYPYYFTFRYDTNFGGFVEITMVRHLDPALSYQLELSRMHNFKISRICLAGRHQVMAFLGVSIANPVDRRVFIRMLVRPTRLCAADVPVADHLAIEFAGALSNALDALQLAMASGFDTNDNILFLHFVPHFAGLSPSVVKNELDKVLATFHSQLMQSRVLHVESRIVIKDLQDGISVNLRYHHLTRIGLDGTSYLYREEKSPKDDSHSLISIGAKGPYNSWSARFPYACADMTQLKRVKAQLLGATYVHDIPELFQCAINHLYTDKAECGFSRLVLNGSGEIDLCDINNRDGKYATIRSHFNNSGSRRNWRGRMVGQSQDTPFAART